MSTSPEPDHDADGEPQATQPSTAAQRFESLWESYARRVHAYALRQVDPDTASEVLSETFLVAWRRLEEVPGNPLPWLLVVARNTIRNAHRSHYRRRVLENELERIAEVAGGSVPGAEALAVERTTLLRGLADLAPKEREALLLVTWDGLTTVEAADVAACSPSAFAMRLQRARQRLSAAMADDDEEQASPGVTRPREPLSSRAAARAPCGVDAPAPTSHVQPEGT
ncbi:RNA polymerase sigma factor [Salana multivorans]